MNRYDRIHQEKKFRQHNGIFRREMSLWEGVALIVSGTVGAGVLGIPYVVAQVGIIPGLVAIVLIGLMMMGLNMLLAQLVTKTGQRLQLVGLAERYLGRVGKSIMAVMFYVMLLGAMVIYIIGEGEALGALFNGDPFTWSILFFAFAAILVLFGLRTIKTIEGLLVLSIFAIVLLIARWTAPFISIDHLSYVHMSSIFLPYGVLLFAYHGVSAIPEAYSLLEHREHTFKKAIAYATGISMLIYLVFAFTVVGVTGPETTEVATVGLGAIIGPTMVLFGNIFAALAMGTSFLLIGVALTDSLQWDYKVPRFFALSIVICVPLLVFLAGVRGFIEAMDLVGGVFISLEMILILLMYWKAKQRGDLSTGRFRVHHAMWLLAFLLLALSVGSVYSLISLF